MGDLLDVVGSGIEQMMAQLNLSALSVLASISRPTHGRYDRQVFGTRNLKAGAKI